MSTGKASAKLADNQTLTASYVDTAAIGDFLISEESVATLDIFYTTGAAETNNSMELKLLFSYDGVEWVQETYSSLSGGTNTLAPMAHTIAGASAGTEYTAQIVVPFCSRHLKVQIKETGVAANYGNATIILTVAAASGQERNVAATNVTISGGATEAKQDAQIVLETSIDGKITACNTGAVGVASGAITETNSAAIKTAVEVIDNAISGSEMQVDIVAELPAGTALIGKVANGIDTSQIYNGTTSLTPKFALANVAASQTDANIVTAVGGKKIRVHQVVAVSGGTATNLTLNTKGGGAGTAISPIFAHGVNGGEVLPFSPMGWLETTSGEALTVTTGAGSATGILVGYTEV